MILSSFQITRRRFPGFKTPQELSELDRAEQIKKLKAKDDYTYNQKLNSYLVLSHALPELKKYGTKFKVPVVIGKIGKYNYRARVEAGWIMFTQTSTHGHGYGNQESSTTYFVLTENGLFGMAIIYGTGYKLLSSYFKVSAKNISSLPATTYNYSWSNGPEQKIASDVIFDKVKFILSKNNHRFSLPKKVIS